VLGQVAAGTAVGDDGDLAALTDGQRRGARVGIFVSASAAGDKGGGGNLGQDQLPAHGALRGLADGTVR